MSAFDYSMENGATLQECLEGIHSFSPSSGTLYVKEEEGASRNDRPIVAVVYCWSSFGSGPLSSEEVLAILSGAKPVVEWETDEDPANDYIHWRQDTHGRKEAEKKATLLAAQLTLCLAGLWPK